MIEKILVGLLIIIIAFTSLIYYKKRKGLATPGFIMIIFWSIMLFASIIFEDGANGYVGYLWIIVAYSLYSLGYNLGGCIMVSNKKLVGSVSMNKEVMRKYILVIGGVLTIYYWIQFVQNGGIENTAQNAYEYYTSEEGLSFSERVLNQIETVLMYSLPFVGGQYINSETGKRKKKITVIVFVPALLSLLVSSMKLGFIISIMLFVIGYITASIYSGNKIDFKFYINFIKKYWKLIVGFVFLMIFALVIRMGTINKYYVSVAIDKFFSYAFGSPIAFNYWLSGYFGTELGYGTNTFMALLNALGIVNRQGGVYTDVYISTTLSSNVYTAFRGVILDFGTIGGWFFLFLLGAFAGIAMKKYKKTASYGSFLILSMSYLFITYSFILSPYAYMNLTILFPVIVIADYISSHFKFTRRKTVYEK